MNWKPFNDVTNTQDVIIRILLTSRHIVTIWEIASGWGGHSKEVRAGTPLFLLSNPIRSSVAMTLPSNEHFRCQFQIQCIIHNVICRCW